MKKLVLISPEDKLKVLYAVLKNLRGKDRRCICSTLAGNIAKLPIDNYFIHNYNLYSLSSFIYLTWPEMYFAIIKQGKKFDPNYIERQLWSTGIEFRIKWIRREIKKQIFKNFKYR